MGYKNGYENVMSLCKMLSKMNAQKKDFDETKIYVILIKDEELLVEKYNEILNKVSNTIKIGFDGEPVYIGKYLKTKIKSYKEKNDTNF